MVKLLAIALLAFCLAFAFSGCTAQPVGQSNGTTANGTHANPAADEKVVFGNLTFIPPKGFIALQGGNYYFIGNGGNCQLSIAESKEFLNGQTQQLGEVAATLRKGYEQVGNNVSSIEQTTVNSQGGSYNAIKIKMSLLGMTQTQFVVALPHRFVMVAYGTDTACEPVQEAILTTLTSIGEKQT